MHSLQNDTCLQRYILSRDHVLRSYAALADYVLNDTFYESDNKREAFMKLCADDACLLTFRRLLYSLIGDSPSDCLLLEAIHYGNPEKGFHRGFSDLVISQGSKILQLLTYSVTVQSAYIALNSGSDI